MELVKAIENRSTVRNFTNDAVDPNDLKEMVQLAGLAPSVNNSQPWKFIAITNTELIAKMAETVHQKVDQMFHTVSEKDEQVKNTIDYFSTVFEKAPSVIVVVSKSYEAIADKLFDHDQINKLRNYPNIESIGASVQNILLAAVEKGLGACWLSGLMIAQHELEQVLDIQPPWQLATAIAVGKPASETGKRTKKSLDEIFELRE